MQNVTSCSQKKHRGQLNPCPLFISYKKAICKKKTKKGTLQKGEQDRPEVAGVKCIADLYQSLDPTWDHENQDQRPLETTSPNKTTQRAQQKQEENQLPYMNLKPCCINSHKVEDSWNGIQEGETIDRHLVVQHNLANQFFDFSGNTET